MSRAHKVLHLRALAPLVLVAILSACASANVSPGPWTATAFADPADSAAFITRLGRDTLAIERFIVTPRQVVADVVLRVPSTRRTRYKLDLLPSGPVARFESQRVDSADTAIGMPQVVTRQGDTLRITSASDSGTSTRAIAVTDAALPFIDMVHWPFEIALMRARASGQARVTQPLLTGSRVSPFEIGLAGADSMTITHPTRGTMRVHVDSRGRLLGLDAAATTRKLVVERRPWRAVDPAKSVANWAALDAAGRSIGALSGRARDTALVTGAMIVLDHGAPLQRGREVWGALVPFGVVWRTGANEATHFSTDRDLVLDPGGSSLLVHAGRYTLFSIPAEDGGLLIVNRQTGQAGTAYDASQDLGRVRMTKRTLDEPAEMLRIIASPVAVGGEIRIQWDRRELVVPFEVRPR